jgi:glycine cleavage system H protein
MSKILENLKYSKSHEWVRVEGNLAVIGISDHAQSNLGSIVYVEANDIGDQVAQFKPFGVVESVKAASDLLSPVGGEIVDVNQDVLDAPEILNEDCYGNWIVKIEMKDPSELDQLLDAKQYEVESK